MKRAVCAGMTLGCWCWQCFQLTALLYHFCPPSSAAAVPAQEEAGYKLLKVKRNQFGKGGVPFIATHDGRTIRYPDPDIKVPPSTRWAQPSCACLHARAPACWYMVHLIL